MAGKLANLLVTAADNLGIWHLHVVMVLTVCCTVNTHAQQISVNSNGDRVIVFDDGSWRYYEAADSVLLNMEELPLETLMEPNQIKVTNTNVATKTFNYQTYLDYMRGARRYEADLGDQVDQAQEKLYEVEDAIRYAETKDNLQLLEQKSHELELAQGELRAKQKALVQLRSDIAKIRRIGSKAKFDRLRNIQLPDRYLAGIETSEEGLAVQPALMPD
ncbi:MAG: hypothetical protein OEQ53_22915, partial [Saprospiraceae bacterium]|nr:hypothetical protein [Saprospiraceae bacterium]